MRKTCVQPVPDVGVTRRKAHFLPTRRAQSFVTRRINHPLTHRPLHTFIMQLYPVQNAQLTEVCAQLSTLSTPPIIRAKQVQKENNSFRNKGINS